MDSGYLYNTGLYNVEGVRIDSTWDTTLEAAIKVFSSILPVLKTGETVKVVQYTYDGARHVFATCHKKEDGSFIDKI